ncbi:diguanylate cyclase [Bermanella sp. WJH001]|uniref:diguanylate cyclase n=1 Tax=Bermanella sp. WJH001 TaxID=3048005 RepID=UPI0024BDFE6C|nr:diguanylate cyclase [Bermanella sp. WJH001]MDJ1537288.1 diguanylate cyclase [Bermanella sp. WJH001]
MKNISDLNFKTLFENAHIGIIIHAWDTSIVYANPTALNLLRLSYEQAIGKDAFDAQWCFIDEAGKILMVDDYPVNKVKRTRERLSNEVLGVIDSSCEDITWFMVNAYYEGNETDDKFIVVTFSDISDSKQSFSFEEVVENTQDIVVITEASHIKYPAGPKIVYVNKAFEKLTGYSKEEVIGETPRILQGELTSKKGRSRISKALENKECITEILLNYDVNGRPYWIEMNIVPLRNKYAEVTHFAAIERDVSSSKFQSEQLEKRNQDLKALKNNLEKLVQARTAELQTAKSKLEKIAYFDPLTNIPNRRFFTIQTHKLVSGCARRGGTVVFGLLDIDDFKAINDTHGHDEGDAVLVSLAKVLTENFRSDDVYCRFGGEEFAFAVVVDDEAGAIVVAEKLIKAIRKLDCIASSGEKIKVRASLGINTFNVVKDFDLDEKIKQADIAMYQAKQSGKDRYCVYEGES